MTEFEDADQFRLKMKEHRRRVMDHLLVNVGPTTTAAVQELDRTNWTKTLYHLQQQETNAKVLAVVNQIAAIEEAEASKFLYGLSFLQWRPVSFEMLTSIVEDRDWLRLMQMRKEKVEALDQMSFESSVFSIARRWWLGWGS